MFFKKSLIFVFTVFVFCESAFVDTLKKCKINDGDCQKNLLQSMARDYAKTGVPELDIPPFDPIILTNMSLSVLDVIDFTMVEGTAKGVKDCIVNKFVTNVEDGRGTIEMTCDFSIKGHYKLYSDSPLIKSFVGGDTLSGEGNGKVKIEKFFIRIDYRFFIQRRNDELYMKIDPKKTTYSYKVGKVAIFADKLYLGKRESSKLVTGLLNQNWRFLMESFGKPYMDKGMQLVYDFINKIFDSIPTRYFIADDLSAYAKDE